MEDIVLVVVTALISGLLATVVTIWWQHKSELRRKKMDIFETLMSYRYMISNQESVNALNSIDIVFYKDEAVRKAYAAFLNETGKKPEFNPNIADKHLILPTWIVQGNALYIAQNRFQIQLCCYVTQQIWL